MRRAFHKLLMTMVLVALPCVPSSFLSAQAPSGTIGENNDIAIQELERLRSIDYFDSPFGDVLTEMSEQTGLRFHIHESAIENNVDADTPIVRRLTSTRLATILDIMLEPYYCTYSIMDGIVLIASKDYVAEYPDLEVLNCQVLLASIQPQQEFFDGKPPVAPKAPPTPDEGANRGGGVFAIPAPQVQESHAQQETSQETQPVVEVEVVMDDGQRATAPETGSDDTSKPVGYFRTIEPRERLVNLIRETIDPTSWKTNGGYATIVELNGLLVIRQSAHNIREIRDLLQRLEAGGLK